MGGFDPVRVALGSPWEDYWIEAAEPSFADWIEYGRLLDESAVLKTNESVRKPVELLLSFVTAHNLTKRDGSPIEVLTFESLLPSQLGVIYKALYAIGGETANPLKRLATSRARSSGSRKRSRPTTTSGH